MSGAFKDNLRSILEAGEQRREKAYESWVESLSAAEQGALSAHLCFVVLHKLLADVVAAIRERKGAATLQVWPGQLRIDCPNRGVLCTCTLQDSTIVATFYGADVHAMQSVFEAPPTFAPEATYSPIQAFALRIAGHLDGP